MKFTNTKALAALLLALPLVAATPATKPAKSPDIGERIPSEEPLIKDFHSLGLVDGTMNLFRSASPIRDLYKKGAPAADVKDQAKARMQRLYALGIRTIVSFENPDLQKPDETNADSATRASWIAAEKAAAEAAGITFVSRPINNGGPDSLETLSDAQVQALIDPIARELLDRAKSGGVLFHCAAGHDRTGIVAAYIRMKYQHWTASEAIAEMRRLGHNWPKYSHNGGESSWHEEHLKALAQTLAEASPTPR